MARRELTNVNGRTARAEFGIAENLFEQAELQSDRNKRNTNEKKMLGRNLTGFPGDTVLPNGELVMDRLTIGGSGLVRLLETIAQMLRASVGIRDVRHACVSPVWRGCLRHLTCCLCCLRGRHRPLAISRSLAPSNCRKSHTAMKE